MRCITSTHISVRQLIQRRFICSSTCAKNAIQELETDNARLLSLIRKKADEHIELVSRAHGHGNYVGNTQQRKRRKELHTINDAWHKWQRTRESLVETATLLDEEDSTLRSLAVDECHTLINSLREQLVEGFPSLLSPYSETREFSALLELKPGVGGSEANLFMGDLLRMYLRFANLNSWKTKVVGKEECEKGGLKHASLEIIGENAYNMLRWETGVHRVQRVPTTETGGRVHTSTVSIIVLPLHDHEPGNIPVNNLFDMKDVKIEVMRARGAGGQHVNKTESAVRLTHVPTGIKVSIQNERSQLMNKSRAFQILRARLLDRRLQAEEMERRDTRRRLVKSAERSDKIRTYNYVQDRVTDHRIGMTWKNLQSVIDGDQLQLVVSAVGRDFEQGVVENITKTDINLVLRS